MSSLASGVRGVTLLELLLVLTLLGVLSAFSLPAIDGWVGKGRLVSDLDRITDRLGYLRHRAIQEGRGYRLQLQGNELVTYAYNGTTTISCDTVLSPASASWIDLTTTPQAPSGLPVYSRSLPLSLQSLVTASCEQGSGLCDFPTNGICFDRAGRVSYVGDSVRFSTDGQELARLQLSPTGLMSRQRRGRESDGWRSY